MTDPGGAVRVIWRLVVRARYLLMVLVGAGIAADLILGAGHHQISDWLVFEAAAREIVHYHHIFVYEGNALGIYARNPAIQIGPPAILPVAALQWIAPYTLNHIFVGVMIGLGILGVAAAELIARTGGRPSAAESTGTAALVGGLIVVIHWSWCAGHWHHLDDAMALSFVAIACWLIARGRPWWLIGLLIGTAVAAKPWAIALTPVFLGLDRETRSKATLVGIATAAAWWAPFVLGGPGTISALGGYHVEVQNGSVLGLIGIHGQVQSWLRPVQFIGGVAAGILAVRAGGRAWLAAPLAALAIRVLTDPFVWPYYGMGPILFALVWDLARPNARRLPVYTVITGFIEGLWPRLVNFHTNGPASAMALFSASLKLVWAVGILVALTVELRGLRTAGGEPRELPPPDDLAVASTG